MVIIELEKGKLEGDVLKTVFGHHYYSFKGIPYAAPPLGDLRFKPPQPVEKWVGILKAQEHGPVSIQYDPYKHEYLGSEDCLYLNVYSPDIAPRRPLSVMVWIHEGSFFFGSGNSDFHGPDFLLNQGVILVTINYRLNILGFLSLQNDFIPGNAGMKDQVAAFRWIKQNIAKFGGDPENITSFGGSSGSIALSYHLISPMSKGLFKRAILQSGVSDNLLYLHKILHSSVDCPSLLGSLSINTLYRSRSPDAFVLQVCKNNISYFSPITRMCRVFNKVNSKHLDVDIFNSKFSKFKKHIHDIFHKYLAQDF